MFDVIFEFVGEVFDGALFEGLAYVLTHMVSGTADLVRQLWTAIW
jgi:hypothetical protein